MKHWVLVPLLCAAVLASGCMTLGVVFTNPKHTPPSQVIAGGLLGDAAIAGGFNAAKGEIQMGEAEPAKNFLIYYGVLLAVDAVGAALLWHRKER